MYVSAVVGGERVEVEGIAVGGCGGKVRCKGLALLVGDVKCEDGRGTHGCDDRRFVSQAILITIGQQFLNSRFTR